MDVTGTVAAEKRHQTHLSGFSRLEGDAASCTVTPQRWLAAGCHSSSSWGMRSPRRPASRLSAASTDMVVRVA